MTETDAEFLKQMREYAGHFTMFITRDDVDRLLALARRGAAVPDEPTMEMIDIGEITIENAQDSSWGSDADGNRHEYTCWVEGVSGAARNIYRAMLATALKDTTNG